MKIHIVITLTAAVLFAACEKQEQPAAEAPQAEEVVEAVETPPAEEPAPAAAAAADEPVQTAAIGKPAPSFELPDETGKTHKLSDYKGKTVVLEWTNPGCPVVQRHYDAKTMHDVTGKLGDDVVWLAIDSSHTVKPADSAQWKKDNEMTWPVLQDPSGATGIAYGAKTTPHMYVIDPEGVLRYAGAIDDDPFGKKEQAERVNYVVEAVQAIAAGKDVAKPETKAYGCSVKYDS